MDNKRLNRLKEVLSIPTKTYQEDDMVQYLCGVMDSMPNVKYYTDDMNNVYATKGILDEGEFYPMFIAHTDTVHSLVDKIIVQEDPQSMVTNLIDHFPLYMKIHRSVNGQFSRVHGL